MGGMAERQKGRKAERQKGRRAERQKGRRAEMVNLSFYSPLDGVFSAIYLKHNRSPP